jgi:16S rRNA (guanine527-N7)-methyltransferase
VTIQEDIEPLRLGLLPEQIERLVMFERLVRAYGRRLGLVSPRDLGDYAALRYRHTIDSLRAVRAFGGDERLAADLGSGAGFPGIPLAISMPDCRFVLCEPRRRRVGFLELAQERLGLGNVEVFPGRAEDLPERTFDLCTARAFGSLGRSWRAAYPALSPGGRLVYFGGRSCADGRDLEAAARRLPGPHPGSVSSLRVLATSPPLVIMAREVNSHGDP